MSFLRYDVTTNDWVIFAPERTRRPHDLKRKDSFGVASAHPENLCPFCPGNDRLTGPEIFALRGNMAPN